MNFFNIGPMELLLILVIVLMVFGPDKIPEVGASLGKAIRKFRQATKELAEEFDLEEINPTTLANVLEAQADALDRTQQAQAAGSPDSSAGQLSAPAPAETPPVEAVSAKGAPPPILPEEAAPAPPITSQATEDAEERT